MNDSPHIKVVSLNEFKVILKDLTANISEPLIVYGYTKSIFRNLKKHVKLISAAGGIVMNPQREILWIKRLGIWDLPKGKAEKKEDIRQTALREVKEECGLKKVQILMELPCTFHVYKAKEQTYLKVNQWYIMFTEENKTIPQTEENITEIRFFPLDDLEEPINNTYNSLKEMMHELKPLLEVI